MTFVLLMASSAFASPMTFCIEIPTNYVDLVEKADFYTVNTDRAVRGVQIQVIAPNFNQSQFADWSGPDAGCATFDLNAFNTYLVLARAEARVDNRKLRGRYVVSTTLNRTAAVVVDQGWTGGSLYIPRKTYQVPADGPWHALTMGGNILARYNYNVSYSYMFNLLAALPSPSGVPNVHWNENTQHIYAGHGNALITAHNMGYAIGVARDEGQSPNTWVAAHNGCEGSGTDGIVGSGNDVVQKRYTSAAASEGFADWIAVMTFNNQAQNNCVYRSRFQVDFDQDNISDTTLSNRHYSCEEIPTDVNNNGLLDSDENMLDADVSKGDWLNDAVTHFPSCNSPLTNRSTKYDWLRFFWDLSQQGMLGEGTGDVHPNRIAGIWDRANPKNWWPQGGVPNHPNMPGIRILDGCAAEGVAGRCDDQLFNGISHGTGW